MLFFVPNLNQNVITGETSTHFFSMRVRVDDELKVTDLKGNVGIIKILKLQKNDQFISFKLQSSWVAPVPPAKILFQAIPDKQYLDKLMEVLPLSGVTQAYFFFSDYSPEYGLNPERMDRISTRSCEQGELAYKPNFTFLEANELESKLNMYKPILLDIQGNIKFDQLSSQEKSACLIGPEGGWSPKELVFYESLNLKSVNMGSVVWPAWLAGLTWFTRSGTPD